MPSTEHTVPHFSFSTMMQRVLVSVVPILEMRGPGITVHVFLQRWLVRKWWAWELLPSFAYLPSVLVIILGVLVWVAWLESVIVNPQGNNYRGSLLSRLGPRAKGLFAILVPSAVYLLPLTPSCPPRGNQLTPLFGLLSGLLPASCTIQVQ